MAAMGSSLSLSLSLLLLEEEDPELELEFLQLELLLGSNQRWSRSVKLMCVMSSTLWMGTERKTRGDT